jgi:hypothetical protein
MAPLTKACVRGRERARTVSVSAQADYDQIYHTRLLAATPTENETCGNFGGMIARYSYLGNMIAQQKIRYEVPRGLFLFSDWSRCLG